jgi:hypothetical protein
MSISGPFLYILGVGSCATLIGHTALALGRRVYMCLVRKVDILQYIMDRLVLIYRAVFYEGS